MNMSSILRKEVIIPVSVGLVASAGGFAAGYIWRDRKDQNSIVINNSLEDHGDVVREYVDGEWVDPERKQEKEENDEEIAALLREATAIRKIVAKENVERIVASAPHIFKNNPEEPGVVTQNIFDTPDVEDDWDMEAELVKRSPNAPYVISVDEFMSNESDLPQEELTYYSGDDVMVDTHDVPIYGHRDMMGILKFGHGSGDLGVVYIRNEKVGREWEICYHEGYYSVEVMGLDLEDTFEQEDLKHSQRPLKFRGD